VDNAQNNWKVKKQSFSELSENHLFNKTVLPTCCTLLSWMFLRRSWQVRRFSTSFSRACSTWSCTRSIPAQMEVSYNFCYLQNLSKTEPNYRIPITFFRLLRDVTVSSMAQLYRLVICWTRKVYFLTETETYVRFEVFTAVTMKNGVFWDVIPCGSCKNRRFGGT
jgi:hypothetical protein